MGCVLAANCAPATGSARRAASPVRVGGFKVDPAARLCCPLCSLALCEAKVRVRQIRLSCPYCNRECGATVRAMTQFRVSEAARLLGVSDDTVRRWVTAGTLESVRDEAGRQVIAGAELAARARAIAVLPEDPGGAESSARNRFVGLVTEILLDTVMAQVELQCGPHRIVSLMSSEAVRDLGLEIGSLAVAVVKATMVIVEVPREQQ